ncbi:hypothetical protein ABZ901_19595 [Actinacidiphila alni]|uniref:Uncharacterized protein n=1 Tax=Actinacidiphila alni TaxID=380248 RepID=A0A1I2GEG4_9ACTN|nr:hypothetical protein [Actinacidiphila alni]SFF16174.1 hypothetical protein SAMN05216251_10922 [Actinacidiphila alni]
MTTQSPHFYSRQSGTTAGPATGKHEPEQVQTRLPWWAVALPALAFAALLALLSGGTADASTASSSGDLLGRIAAALPHFVAHIL